MTTRSTLTTLRGPLVKAWGSMVPASVEDVEVLVDGIPVAVASVNPYLGQVTLATPLTLTAPDTQTVEVNFNWFPAPTFEALLNTPGLVLNQWADARGRNTTTVGQPLGALEDAPFPLSVVLPQGSTAKPLQTGYRYMGFERAYTAALNSESTLLLNQNPHAVRRGDLVETRDPINVSYEGTVGPSVASPAWEAAGTDTGSSDGAVYQLVDASAAEGAYWTREVDLSLPSATTIAARLQVASWAADGVFTGIGLGFHDNRRLYLLGLLDVNDVKHVGFLQNPTRPDLIGSWGLAGAFDLLITGSNTFTTSHATFLSQAARQGLRFQILSGDQAGVYTVASCGVSSEGGTATVVVSPSFPGSPSLAGNSQAVGYLEVAWDRATTYRMVADVQGGTAQGYVGGSLPGISFSVTSAAYPAQTSLLLPTAAQGAVFWGSLSRPALSDSSWSFVRYGVAFTQPEYHFSGIEVTPSLSVTPDQDAVNPWFVTEDFGYGIADGALTVASLAASSTFDFSYGYARLEPFFGPALVADLDATFRVPRAVLGADTVVTMDNGKRVAQLAVLTYVEGGTPYRQLAPQAVVSSSGFQLPGEEGWATVGAIQGTVREQVLSTTGVGSYQATLALDAFTSAGREMEVRVSTASQGVYWGVRAGGRDVALALTSGGVRLQSNGVAIATYAFSAFDGEELYLLRVNAAAGTVQVYANGVLLGSQALSSFTVLGSDGLVYWGSTTGVEAAWSGLCCVSLPVTGALRTLGVLKGGGGSPADIDSWEIPRTDATTGANSSVDAVVEAMNWTSDVEVTLRIDPGWGCTLFRPDLAPPPYYDPTQQATQITNPSEGWINVEYPLLPRSTGGFGRIAFGALDPQSTPRQIWGAIGYRLYSQTSLDFIAPQGMVLNRSNVINSGEWLQDTSPTVVTVDSITRTLVSLAPAHINAARVFSVVVDGVVLATTDWSFSQDDQAIYLTTALPDRGYPVTVTLAPGKPVTNTYLCQQPLLQSTTLLNEGTPPVPLDQVRDADPANYLYEDLEFCEVSEGEAGLLYPVSDEQGLIGLEITGDQEVAAAGSMQDPSSFPIFSLAGGFHAGVGTLNGCSLYPNNPALPRIQSVQSELETDTATAPSDATPATLVSGEVNPSGPPVAQGAAVGQMVDAYTQDWARLGPWGGLEALSLQSLLYGTTAGQPEGVPASGYGLRLVGGVELMSPVITDLTV